MHNQYDFLVIGGGPGGTPTATALASAGKRVLLVEKGAGPGGTCLFEGCIPSKILRESARRLRELREASAFGLCLPTRDIHIDWSAIQERKRAILKKRSSAAMQRLQNMPTLDIVLGKAELLDARHARISPHDASASEITFEHAIVATGSLPAKPPIRGVDDSRVMYSEQILDIDHVPKKLAIIGGGPIGVELGQIFNTFGSEVTLFEIAPQILGPVDHELAEHLARKMRDEGIRIITDCRIDRLAHTGKGVFVEYHDNAGKASQALADNVLLVTGRRPNVEGLGLENTAVRHGPHGIEVDARLQTAETSIHAVGDVIGPPMFAHWATAQGLALAKRLLGMPATLPDPRINSAVIFSEPEIAMAGLTETQAREKGIDHDVARYDFRGDARAQIAERASGLLKIVYEKSGHRVIGVHALVEGAGELMGEAALAVAQGIPLEALAMAIHPHPTLTESFAQAARAALAKHPAST